MCQGLGPKKHDEISEIDRTSSRCGAPEPLGLAALVLLHVFLIRGEGQQKGVLDALAELRVDLR